MSISKTLVVVICGCAAWSGSSAQVPTKAGSVRTKMIMTRADTAAPSRLSAGARVALDAGTLHRVDSVRTSAVPADTPRVVTRAGQFLAFREVGRPTVVRRRLSLGAVASPQMVEATAIPLTYTGRASDNTEVSLHPLMIREKSLRYAADVGNFQGSFLMFLEDRNAPNARRDLGTPIEISMASDDSLTPTTLALRRTNDLTRVSIVAREPADSVRVRIVPSFNMTEDISVSIPVLPVLILERLPRRASGLGIQTVDVLVGLHGQAPRDSVRVALTTDRGTLTPNEVVVTRGGHAHAKLRTMGIGTASLSATSPGIDRADGTIRYSWPFDFLAIALIGGGVGAVTTQLSRKRRRGNALRRFVAGCMVGFVVALVYFGLGVSLLSIQLPTQVLNQTTIFGLSLLGGLFGIPALESTKAAKSLLGGDSQGGGD